MTVKIPGLEVYVDISTKTVHDDYLPVSCQQYVTDKTNFVMNSYIPQLTQVSQHFHIKVLYCNVSDYICRFKGHPILKTLTKKQQKLWRWPNLKM